MVFSNIGVKKTLRIMEPLIKVVTLCLFSALVLLIVSKNSPFYLCNDWVDVNTFDTVGRSWMNGLLPYKDLFEQKGPILYLLFALASTVSKTYFGIYIAEIISFTVTLFIFYKTARLVSSKKKSIVFIFVSTYLLTASPYFSTGGSAEEFMLPAISFSIFLILKLIVSDYSISNVWYFSSGLSFAYIFWIKYTAIGGYIGIASVLVIILLLRHEIKRLFLGIISAALGAIAVTVPILSYFYFKQGLHALVFNYFYANIKLYSGISNGAVARVILALSNFLRMAAASPLMLAIVVVGIVMISFSKNIFEQSSACFLFFGAYFCMIVTTLAGGRAYQYYFLAIMPYICLAVLEVLVGLKWSVGFKELFVSFLVTVALTAGFNTSITKSRFFKYNSTIDTQLKKTVPYQTEFAKIINRSSNATLLNYNALDLGVYKSANIIPSNKYFQIYNIPSQKLPQMMDSQNKLIADKKIEFVVTRAMNGQSLFQGNINLKNNYKIVDTRYVVGTNNQVYRMILFKRH